MLAWCVLALVIPNCYCSMGLLNNSITVNSEKIAFV